MKLTDAPLPGVEAGTFRAWLEHVRHHRGWSRAEVARRLGVDRKTVRHWHDDGAPAHVGLACSALVRGLGQWRPPEQFQRDHDRVPDDRA